MRGPLRQKVRAAEPRKQKHDRRDARLLLNLLAENRFPAIWMPSTEQRDLRTLLRHRHQWVRMRTRVQHTLQSLALANGLRRGTTLWSQVGRHGVMTDLGTLVAGPATTTVSVAFGINNAGQVVGYSQIAGQSPPPHVVLWQHGKIFDLNPTGWQTLGYAINNRGQIAGFGSNPTGQSHGFLLTPEWCNQDCDPDR